MFAVTTAGAAVAQSVLAGPWSAAEASKVRLIAGAVDAVDATGRQTVYAGVQMRLDYKWKTYWRSPGEAGGVPPRFDFSNSENVARAEVLYPAPLRFNDAIGETIGYHSEVIFPVRFTPKDASKSARLRATIFYGICKDICIPIERTLALTVPPTGVPAAPAKLKTALSEIPRRGTAQIAADPKLLTSAVVLSGDAPHISFEAKFPADAVTVDAFIEPTKRGAYVPQLSAPQDLGNGRHRFVVDLSSHDDLSELAGVDYRVTLVAEQGQSEFVVEAK